MTASSQDVAATASEFGISSRGAYNQLYMRGWSFFEQCLATPWSPETPGGVVNLGVAENSLMHTDIVKFVEENTKVDPVSQLTYGNGPRGSPRLKRALAGFLNRKFSPLEPVIDDDIIVMAGVTPIIDALAWALCNEGEGIIIPQPYYAAFATDIPGRARGVIIPATFQDIDGYKGFDDVFSADMSVKSLEKALSNAQSKGIKATAVMLVNPHNPLGRCYTPSAIKAIASFCQAHNLHLISDEIYAQSIYTNPNAADAVPFTSALALGLPIDAQKLHVAYGASKDFCANGLRLGMLHTRNKGLMGAIASNAMLGWPPYLVQDIWAAMLENTSYTDSFLQKNQALLAESYRLVTDFLAEQGVGYFKNSNAGMFLWIDLRRHLVGEKEGELPELRVVKLSPEDLAKYLEREQLIWKVLGKNKILLAMGSAFATEELGWFRLTFSASKPALEVGLERLKNVFEELLL
ncbi:putative 1-aminocyclopropane-1-carboxylate synthase [Triangularia verruculosa]|uniref:1-aminocyclopropane-1-carboxylate synthase n=1 Tax=Triangularia verruculosa TaxID=2587418 RepID=A0AAN6XHQ6_9PEZI|nr:putative 1-aminocyclopropane-1-carboxylate synthase [Triangularia verruculosa]